jgi:uroporphyrinogen III methyltransferase/synthase
VLVLRPEQQASQLARLLVAEGAEPVLVPAIRILPPDDWTAIDRAVERLQAFEWIVFTSVNGVDHFLSRLPDAARLAGKVGAIGPGTKQSLVARGIEVAWMPRSFTSAALGEQLPGPPAKVLLVRADIATAELEDTLRARGFELERVDAYRTEAINGEEIRAVVDRVDAVALTSASIARSFGQAAGRYGGTPPAICSIGPATSQACRAEGLSVDVEAREHTIAGLVRAMSELFGKNLAPRRGGVGLPLPLEQREPDQE